MRALTANRLADGEAVFWNKGKWVDRFAQAQLFDDKDAAETAEAEAKSELTLVVDPYLIDVMQAEDVWAPVSFRERIRCLGPSNHPQHGKQAEGGHDLDALAHATGAARSTGRVNLIKRK
jgi:sulfite reductase (NADPH) hemoprotein beta-component